MIRPASTPDLPRLLELLLEMQGKSKYARLPDPVDVDIPTARSLLLTGVQRQGSKGIGSSLFLVIEVAGVVEGFILGLLDRIYHIGNRLQANDIYLYCTDKAPRSAATRLLDGYIEWAAGNPKVAKIMLSWTDALGAGNERIERMYEKKGFIRVGGIFERDGQ